MQYKRTRDEYIEKVDFMFYHEADIKKAVRERRMDSGHTGKATAGKSGYISDPTAQEAIRNVTPIKSIWVKDTKVLHPEKWLYVIRATYEHLDNIQSKVARSRYHGENYQDTCIKLCISSSTYARIMAETRMYAAACAAQFGLVKIVPDM